MIIFTKRFSVDRPCTGVLGNFWSICRGLFFYSTSKLVASAMLLVLTGMSYTTYGQMQVGIPVHAGSLVDGTGGAFLEDPQSVYVSGNYAYVASELKDALEIVDISNPAAPVHKSNIAHGTGGALLDGPQSVYVSGNYAYVVSLYSNSLAIIDISNPAAPVHKGSLSHGAGGALMDAPSDVYVLGNYAYVVSGNSNALEIVNISNPASPVHAGSLRRGTDGALLYWARSVYVSGNYAYVVSNNSNSLEIIDVSNPAAPVLKGSLIHGTDGALLDGPQSVFISGNYAYVASDESHALEIINISNPSAPVHAGSLTHGTAGAVLLDPQSVYVSGNYAYVVSKNSSALEIVDVSNPSSPLHKSSITNGEGGAKLWGAQSVYVSGTYAYVASYTNDALEVVNVSNPSAPAHAGSLMDGDGGAQLDGAISLYVSGNYAYVTSFRSQALEIADISNPASPVHVGSLKHNVGGAILSDPYSVFVAGNHAYVTNWAGNELEIIDVSNPSQPVHKGAISNGMGGAKLQGARSVYVSGNYAYVASINNNALEIVDISNPAAPVHKGSLTDGTGGAELKGPQSVYVSGNYAYVVSTVGSTLEIINISDPAAPVHTGSLAHGTGGALLKDPWSVYVSGNYAYVASSDNDALEIIDVSNPSAPVHVGSLTNGTGNALLDGPRGVYVSGNYAYVASAGSNALEIVDVSNPAAPVHFRSLKHSGVPGGAVMRNPLSVSVSGDYAYLVSSESNSLEAIHVAKQNQVIDFDVIAAKTYGAASFSLDATTSSGLAVVYESSDESVATISGKTVTIVGTGSTTITASQAGDEQYYAATSVSHTLTVNKAALVVKAKDKTRPYGTDNPELTVSCSGFVNGDDADDITLPVASTTATSSSNAGAYAIVPAGGSADNYTFTYENGTLTLTKADQAITFDALAPKNMGDPDFNLTATSTSGLDVSYSSSNLQVAQVNGNTVTIVGGGTTEITAMQPGNINYNAATPVVRSLVVKVGQTITFPALSAKKYGDAGFQLNATSSSGLPVAFESLNTAVATIDGNVVAIMGAGTARIVARQAGDALYNPAAEVQQTLTVSKAIQTITFNALPDKRLSDETFILPATASSGLPVSYVSSHPDIASIDGQRISLHKAGTVAIAANQAGNQNYEPAMQVPQTLTILKNLQSIAFAALPSKIFGEAPFTLSATASSSLSVVYESSNASVATVVNNTVTLKGAGTTTITASQSGNDTFEAASVVQQTLIVELVTGLEGPDEVLVGVYPNPVHDALNIRVPAAETVQVEMFDAMGRVVARETSFGEDLALPVDHLQPGIYHVKIGTARQVITRQVIKK